MHKVQLDPGLPPSNGMIFIFVITQSAVITNLYVQLLLGSPRQIVSTPLIITFWRRSFKLPGEASRVTPGDAGRM